MASMNFIKRFLLRVLIQRQMILVFGNRAR